LRTREGEGMSTSTTGPSFHRVRFILDPVCPWTWKTARWILAVARVRPIRIQWGLLALAHVNRDNPDNPMKERHLSSLAAIRLLALARLRRGNEAMGKLYEAIGEAHHERGEPLDHPETLKRSLRQAGLPESWIHEPPEPHLRTSLEEEYLEIEASGAFGVPCLFIDDAETPFFGPVIDRVPPDPQAGELWDLILGLWHHDYFYELKRPRI